MPLFNYSITLGGETRTVEMRRSNPQGWLIEAVKAVFPDLATRRAGEIIRLRLEKAEDGGEAWKAVLNDPPDTVLIHVVKMKG